MEPETRHCYGENAIEVLKDDGGGTKFLTKEELLLDLEANLVPNPTTV